MKTLHIVSLPAMLQAQARSHVEEAQRLVSLALDVLPEDAYTLEWEEAESNLYHAAVYLEPEEPEAPPAPVLRVVQGGKS